jgi:hypothetical protein
MNTNRNIVLSAAAVAAMVVAAALRDREGSYR